VVIFWAFWVRLIELREPWTGHHDFNGAWVSLAARNFINYGFLETKLGVTTNSGPPPDNGYSYYLHHPPLITWLVSISFMVYGISEGSARIVSVYFSIGTIVFIFLLSKNLFNINVALFAAFLQAFIPMDAFFGRLVNHEPLILFFAMALIYFFVEWLNGRKHWSYMPIITFWGCLSGWAFYYLPFLIFLHYLFFKRKPKALLKLLPSPVICLLCFLGFLSYIYFLTGSINGGEFGSIFEAFKVRISSGEVIKFTIKDFFSLEFHRILRLLTLIVTLFSLFFILTFATVPKRRLAANGDIQQAYVHDYLLFNLSPFMSLSTAVVVDEISKILKEHFRIPVAIVPVILFFAFVSVARSEILRLHNIKNLVEEYNVGDYIKNHTQPEEAIITSIRNGSAQLQLKYYSQRYLVPEIISKYDLDKILKDSKRDYRFFLDRQRVGKSEILDEYLKDNFTEKRIGNYILYDLKKPLDKDDLKKRR